MSKLPEIEPGNERAFIKCKHCGRPGFYDYVPYSLSSPILYCKGCISGGDRYWMEYIDEGEFHRLTEKDRDTNQTNVLTES